MAKKKQPNDYPQLSFRISTEDKKRINELAASVVEKSNAALPPGTKLFRKNDVLVDALYLGLLTLQRKGMKLSSV